MARVICSISSIEFNCEHFPAFLHHQEYHHPVFNIPQRKLLPYLHKWSAGELTKIDSYLLFLALLNSSNLIVFRTPISRNENTDSIVAQNMEFLAKTVHKLNTVNNPAVQFPQFAVTGDNKYLTNVYHWIEVWNVRYEDFLKGARNFYNDRKLAQKEAVLERLIKNPHKPISQYSHQLAEWAATAADFPEIQMTSPVNGEPTTLAEYWKYIIQKCASETGIYSVPDKHIKELLEHCEDCVNVLGSIFSRKLFEVLRNALNKHKDFIGIADYYPSYKFLEETEGTSTEVRNIKMIVDSSPTEEPQEKDFATKFLYLKAKTQWKMAKRFGSTGKENS